MAIEQISISDVSNILQKIIAPRIEELLPQETIWYDMLTKNAGVSSMANNSFYVTLRTGRHSGIAAVTEGAKLASGKQKYSQTQVTAKYVFGTFDISDQTLEAAKGQPGSLANSLTETSSRLREDFARDLNRMFWYDGDGILAKTSASGSSSDTVTLTNWAGLATNNAEIAIQPTKWLADGMKIRIATNDVIIETVDSDSQITLTTSESWAAAASITKADGDGAATEEPMGVRGIVDDGTVEPVLQGITRSGAPWWNSFVESSSAALSESLLMTSYLRSREYGRPKFIFMNWRLFKKYGDLLTSMKKTATTKEVLTGGWTGLEFAGADGTVMVVVDYDTPDKEVYGIDPASLTIAQLAPLGWVDRGDGVLRRTDYASWQAVMKWYGNLCGKNPRANFKLTNKTTA